ncbi:HDIG domain-containing protein [candidate division WOR-3 bacterium]|nr:HDIG domain-containing protein [candidate division WOR-3 bacterium]
MKLKIPHKYLILTGIILLLNIIFPPPMVPSKYSISDGEIASSDVIAPYDFFIPKTEQELNEEKEEIAKRIPPVYESDNTILKMVGKKIEGLERLIDSLSKLKQIGEDSLIFLVQKEYAVDKGIIKYLIKKTPKRILGEINNTLVDLYAIGIVDSKLPGFRIITIIIGDKEMVESIDRLYSIAEAESILSLRQKPEYKRLVEFLLTPNLIYNKEKTGDRIEEVFANVPKTKGEILKGEIIVEKHKRVTEDAMTIMHALESTYISIGTWEIIKTIFFRNLLYFSLIFLLFNLSRVTKSDLFDDKNIYFITLLSAGYLIIGKIAYVTDTMYLLPISFFIFLFALYFNIYFAVIFTIIFSSLFGITLNSISIFTFLFVSGMVAVFSTQTINSRLSLYRPMIYIALANVAAILFADVYLLKGQLNLVHLSEGVLNSILGGVFFVLLLPLFEKLFDFTTDLTLLELGNLNLPLFKEMALEAPGTYHHSIVVGSLAEVGARVIGADPILARVGSYYHDIGKLKKPQYFIENQIGIRNPHDDLKPQMSALIIISHVKDGVEMAKKMKLPNKLVSIIEQHHGTTTIEPFYKKALEISSGVNEDTFRYPGPKPKTKESALIMLADTVEAAARSEKNITVTKLQKILKDSIAKKFNDGQLDECPINRQDLEQVKTAFLSILTGVFHPRIEYVEPVKKTNAEGEDKNRYKKNKSNKHSER